MAHTYLVTGGAGFIGSNIAHALVEAGHKVRILDDLSTGRRDNLSGIEDKITFIEGSILDEAALEDAVKGVDFVLHEAALPSVQRSMEEPQDSHRVNADGTLAVLLAAKDAGVRRVVYAASSSAYGNIETLPKVETMRPEPASVYAVSKLMGEYYGRVMTESFGLEVISLRYFNVFGPRQDPNSHYAAVIPRFITSMLKDVPPVIFGDGRQSRDFCFIENVVHANLLACQAPSSAAGHVYNIACGERIDLLDLVRELNSILEKDIRPNMSDPRPGDVKHSLADISAAQEALGYEVLVRYGEGLRRTIDWYATMGRRD